MRKWSKALLLAVCLLACGILLVFSKGGIRQSLRGRAKAVSAEEYTARKAAHTEDKDEIQVRAYYQGYELPFDAVTSNFMLFGDTDASKIEFHAGEGVELVYSEDKSKLLACKDGVYKEYGFWKAAVPVLVINSNGEEIGAEEYVAADMTLYDARQKKTAVSDWQIKLHTRGASSHWIEKKSYRVKFKALNGMEGKTCSFLDMDPTDEWVLYSFYGDESKMREKLGRDLWHDITQVSNYADKKNGLQMEFCEVYLGDEYVGLYGLGTAVSERLLFGERTKENLDLIFKTTNFVAPTIEQTLNAGRNDKCETLTLKYESWYHYKRWHTIGEYMNLAYYAPDEEYQEQIKDYWYEENAIDYWLFLQASGLDDNELKNIYFSVQDAKDNKRILITPWDLDMSWGVEYTGENIFMWGRNPERYQRIIDFPIISRMFQVQDEEFIRALQKRWEYLRQEVITEEKLVGRVREYYNILYKTGVIERERAKWPEAPRADDIEYIENYIKDRIPYLDRYIETLGQGTERLDSKDE